jgi:hypothetical protein
MESKHTPGPWEVRENITPSEYGTVEVYKEDGNKWIASALGTHVGPRTKEEAKANAHLIAAAPDMFEVIKAIYEYYQKNNVKGYMHEELEAAYLKATGQAISPIENQ